MALKFGTQRRSDANAKRKIADRATLLAVQRNEMGRKLRFPGHVPVRCAKISVHYFESLRPQPVQIVDCVFELGIRLGDLPAGVTPSVTTNASEITLLSSSISGVKSLCLAMGFILVATVSLVDHALTLAVNRFTRTHRAKPI